MRETELNDLLKGAAEAAFVVDLQGSVRYLNPAAEKLFGISNAKACALHCAQLLDGKGCGGEQLCSESCPTFELARQGKAVESFDLQVRASGGTRRWVNISILIGRGASGEVRIVHLARDVESRKKLELVTRQFLQQVGSLTGQQVEDLLASGPPPHVGLTDQERNVLQLLSLGRSTKAIAVELGISARTVRNHVQHLLQKLHVHSRTTAVLRAVKERLVPASPSARES